MKLVKIKTLETRIWKMCRQHIRSKYPNTCFTCGKENLQGKDWTTGHFIKKGMLPYSLKYSEMVLRPQCQSCNRGRNGNEAIYALNLLKTEGEKHLLEIDRILYEDKVKEELWGVKEKREFLLGLEQEYATILSVLTRG